MSHSESYASCVVPSVSVQKLLLQEEAPSSKPCRWQKWLSKAADSKCLVAAPVLNLRYKDKAFTSAETVEKAKEWLKEEAAHDVAKTVEETGEAEDPLKRVQTEPLQQAYNLSTVCMLNFLEQLTIQLRHSPASKLNWSGTWKSQWLRGLPSLWSGGREMTRVFKDLLYWPENISVRRSALSQVSECSARSGCMTSRGAAFLERLQTSSISLHYNIRLFNWKYWLWGKEIVQVWC